MKLSTVRGVIRRRILVSFRVDPEVVRRDLPPPFRPKRVGDAAVAGLCLIRLEQMRPSFLALPCGMTSENAAHRMAVCWTNEQGQNREGVYIPVRHTNSVLNHLTGGRLFPGQQKLARFDVRDEEGEIDFRMESADGRTNIQLRGRQAETLPATSCFGSLEAASAFYQAGSLGYSARNDGGPPEAMALDTVVWRVAPLEVEFVYSSYFADERRFPKGSVQFDSALLMRDILHQWQTVPG
jgi:hypothetical protein